MLIKEKEFHKRKNKKEVYESYVAHLTSLQEVASTLLQKVRYLELTMQKYRSHTYIYRYLSTVRSDISSIVMSSAHVYAELDSDHVIGTLSRYRNMYNAYYQIVSAIGMINSATDFINMFEKYDLSLTK